MAGNRMERYNKKSGSRKLKSSKKKKKKKKIIIVSLLFLLLFLVGVGSFYIYSIFGNLNRNTISKSSEDLGIDKETEETLKANGKDDIINIALFGLDQREANEASRSDATMVLTIDKEHKKVKMSSIMRDSYVNIDKHGKDKLNHAYAFGGPELAIKTLNQNFKLNIKDYVAVNFKNMEDVIDALDGVDITIKKEEITPTNACIQELADLRNAKAPLLNSSGNQHLNGLQALGYSRVRDIGNGDFDRTDRQRTVLNALFEKIKSAGVTQYPFMVSKLLPLVETSMSSSDILSLGKDVLSTGIGNLEQERFPIDGYCKDGGEMIKGVWYLPFDQEATIKHIHDYIFDDTKPTPKK